MKKKDKRKRKKTIFKLQFKQNLFIIIIEIYFLLTKVKLDNTYFSSSSSSSSSTSIKLDWFVCVQVILFN